MGVFSHIFLHLANYQLIVYNIVVPLEVKMNNRIELSKKEVLDILDIVKNKNKRLFRFLPRDLENDKNPRDYMTKIGIDYDDAIKIIKNLEFDNIYECILDIKNKIVFISNTI